MTRGRKRWDRIHQSFKLYRIRNTAGIKQDLAIRRAGKLGMRVHDKAALSHLCLWRLDPSPSGVQPVLAAQLPPGLLFVAHLVGRKPLLLLLPAIVGLLLLLALHAFVGLHGNIAVRLLLHGDFAMRALHSDLAPRLLPLLQILLLAVSVSHTTTNGRCWGWTLLLLLPPGGRVIWRPFFLWRYAVEGPDGLSIIAVSVRDIPRHRACPIAHLIRGQASC